MIRPACWRRLSIPCSRPAQSAVSGGCVEGAVVEVAERIIDGADPQLLHYGIADEDAWDVGLPCGGEISVWVQNYIAGEAQARARVAGRAGIHYLPREASLDDAVRLVVELAAARDAKAT